MCLMKTPFLRIINYTRNGGKVKGCAEIEAGYLVNVLYAAMGNGLAV